MTRILRDGDDDLFLNALAAGMGMSADECGGEGADDEVDGFEEEILETEEEDEATKFIRLNS